MNETTKAHLALIIVNLIYGANYVIAKEVMPAYIQPFGFIVLRVSFALCLFWLFHYFVSRVRTGLIHKKIERKDWGMLAACGLFGVAINQLMFFKGLSLTAPINASLIMITTPILVLIMAAIIIKEKITSFKLFGVLLGCIGAGLIIWFGNKAGKAGAGSRLGDLLVFINASSYALYLVLVKPLMARYHAITVVKWVFFFGFLIVMPFGWNEFTQIEWNSFPVFIWACVVYVVIATTFITYLFNIYALQKVNASVVSTYIYTQPVIATIIAISFGKDSLSLIKVGAAIMIFIGVFLVSHNFAPTKN